MGLILGIGKGSSGRCAFFVLAVSGFAVVGCNSSSDVSSNDQNLQYQLIENGCDTGMQQFSSKDDYCAGLKDDGRNHFCALELRHERYQSDCGNDWPETNSAPEPIATATFSPAPPSSPVPPPEDTRPQVERDLEAQGIRITIETGLPEPGQPSVPEQLPAFWDALGAVEADVLARKASIHELHISQYVSYASDSFDLTVDVGMSAGDLRTYLALLDRRIELETSTGIQLDLGVEDYGAALGGLDPLVQEIMFLELNLPQLKGAVRKLVVGEYINYQLSTRVLTVTRKQYQEDIPDQARALVPAVPFFKLLDKLGIEIQGDFDFEKNQDGFSSVTRALTGESTALSDLVQFGALKTLDLSSYSTGTRYYDGLKQVTVATKSPGLEIMPQVLEALTSVTRISQSLGVSIKLLVDADLDEGFIAGNQLLIQVVPDIRSKLPSIHGIYFSDQSSFDGLFVTIGKKDNVGHLRQVIRAIP